MKQRYSVLAGVVIGSSIFFSGYLVGKNVTYHEAKEQAPAETPLPSLFSPDYLEKVWHRLPEEKKHELLRRALTVIGKDVHDSLEDSIHSHIDDAIDFLRELDK